MTFHMATQQSPATIPALYFMYFIRQTLDLYWSSAILPQEANAFLTLSCIHVPVDAVYEHCASCRSEHFPEFFHAPKGTSSAVNNIKTATADASPVAPDQHAQRLADPNTASPSTQDAPASMAQTTLDTVSQAQNVSGPVQTGAPPPEDDDPQTLRQLQHEQAQCGSQADLQVRFADVGCGFGGLLVRLSPMYPDKLMVGMEIRDKVCCCCCCCCCCF